MNQKKSFRPQNLRAILGVLLALVFVGGGIGFYWGLGIVKDYSVEVNQRLVDADASGNQITELQKLKETLAQNNTLVAKAGQLLSTPSAYQNQLLNDVRNAANNAGLSVESANFTEDPSQPYTVTVQLRNPVSYAGLITFLNNIESNLPKLQVTSLNIESGNGDAVTVGEIKINIAVR